MNLKPSSNYVHIRLIATYAISYKYCALTILSPDLNARLGSQYFKTYLCKQRFALYCSFQGPLLTSLVFFYSTAEFYLLIERQQIRGAHFMVVAPHCEGSGEKFMFLIVI